jgi:hypothetical protein
LAQEAQTKAINDQQVEMEAKAKADQENQAHLPPPPFRPLAEQRFMQYMQFMQETQKKFMQELMGHVGAGKVSEARGVSLSDFLNAKPLPFASAVEPMHAEDWLLDTERKLKAVGANDEEKVRYSVHLLSGPAVAWWDNEVTRQLPEKVFSWEEFKEKFRTFHVPESVVELKRREFEDLTQGSATMMAYIKKFTRLSRYASDEVSTDIKWVKRFLRGLDPYAAMQMKLTKPRNFQELMDTAITWENDYKLVQMSRLKRAKTEAKKVQPTRSTASLSFKPRVRTGRIPPNRRAFTPKDQIICHKCRLPGHMKNECVKPRIICYACEKEGHIHPDCPNKPAGGCRITVEARLEEVDDLHPEVAVAARMETEKEEGILGG